MSNSLEESLVDFFKRTNVSCAIIKTLYDADAPIKFDKLVNGVEQVLEGNIPSYAIEGAVKASLRILKATGWLELSETEFQLTSLGSELAGKITGRTPL